MGQTWHEFRQIIYLGVFEYLYSSINIINFCLNILYCASYSLKYYTMFYVSNSLKITHTDKFWLRVANLKDSEVAQTKAFETFYWLNSGL